MNNTYDIHTIRPGDQLFSIMRSQYGDAKFFSQRDILLSSILSANPHIKDINRIYTGSTLALPVLAPTERVEVIAKPSRIDRSANESLCRAITSSSRVTKECLHSLQAMSIAAERLNDFSPFINTTAGVYSGLGKVAGVAQQYYGNLSTNLQFTQALMKSGKLTRRSYYQNRGLVLDATDQRFSVIRDHLGRKIEPTSKVLRVSQNNAKTARSVAKSLKFAEKLGNRAKIAGRGFAVLSTGVGAARYMGEDNSRERSVIVLETAGSLGAGYLTGLALTAALVSNPVGWGVIIGVTMTSLVAGYAGGEIGKFVGESLHDSFGNRDQDVLQALFD